MANGIDTFSGARNSLEDRSLRLLCPDCMNQMPVPFDAQHCARPRRGCAHAGPPLAAGLDEIRARPEFKVTFGSRTSHLDIPSGISSLSRHVSSGRLTLHSGSDRTAPLHFIRRGDAVWVSKLDTSGVIRLNGILLRGTHRLSAADCLAFGNATLSFAVPYAILDATKTHRELPDMTVRQEQYHPQVAGALSSTIPLQDSVLTLGSAEDGAVVLRHPRVCLAHARIERHGTEHILCDLASRWGTFLNGHAIKRAVLRFGDQLQLGGYVLQYDCSDLQWIRRRPAVSVAASGLALHANHVRLLDDVSLVARPGELVGLLGPSGSGKSSLLNALSGARPASNGKVWVNGVLLQDEYALLRRLIGYVPQADIVHGELTCAQALFFAGRLRLPDLSPIQIRAKAKDTLAAVGLSDRADVRVADLSGGQRKRVSVGLELLSEPSILFLDEPTSGLDPAAESRLMRLFRRIAESGTPVVCTTHVMQNVKLFDKVAVLAPTGKLAFFGQPAEARSFFAARRFPDVYDRLEERSPVEWQKKFVATPEHARLQAAIAAESQRIGRPPQPEFKAPRSPGAFKQWAALTSRFLLVLKSDRRSLLLMLALPIVLTVLTCAVFEERTTVLFLQVIAALWLGTSLASQQLVKERAVYRRERMVNLRIGSYLASKLAPLIAIGTLQAGLMLGTMALWSGLEGSASMQAAALILVSCNAAALGLMISALAANADRAAAMVPASVLPQVVLGGMLLALPAMSSFTRVLADLAPSRWANQAMQVSVLQDATITPELLARPSRAAALWNLYPEFDLQSESGRQQFLHNHLGQTISKKGSLWRACSVMIGMFAAQVAVLAGILRRQDYHKQRPRCASAR